MYRLQVTAHALNKRKRIPVAFPDTDGIVGIVLQGFSFIGERVHPSELNSTTERWYRDRDGYYYLGSWLIEIEEAQNLTAVEAVPKAATPATSIPFDPNTMSWGHKLYDIPFIWQDLNTMGEGVNVAVIDTGIDVQHDDLVSKIHPLSKSFVGSAADFNDNSGHGTQMAGIIGAAGMNKVYGIAPQAGLVVLKATPDGSGTDLQKFIDAVLFAADQPEVDIISISYSFVVNDTDVERLKMIQKLKEAVHQAINKGKIVVASIGDLRTSLSPPEDRDTFPSSFNDGIPKKSGVLAIGSFDQAGKVCGFSHHNKHLLCLAPGDKSVLTTGLNNSVANGGQTSIAAAFTSGCLALMVSYCKVHHPGQRIDYTSVLLDTCDDLGPSTGPDIISGFGKINIRNAVAKIKSL
jgi:major intracellular serine protease